MPTLGEAADADERRAEGEALEVLERERADDRAVDAPQLAAEQHAVDARARPRAWSATPRLRRQHREPQARRSAARRRRPPRPSSRCRGTPSRRPASSCTHASRDRLLGSPRCASWRSASSRSTVGCSASAPPCVRFSSPRAWSDAQVLADRRLGDAERLRQLADPGAPAHGDQLGDPRLPLVREHGCRRSWPRRIVRSVTENSTSAHECLRSGSDLFRFALDWRDPATDETIGYRNPRHGIRSKLRIGILTSGGDAPGMNAVDRRARASELNAPGGRACRHPRRLRRTRGRRAERAHGAEARAHAHEPGTWLGTSRWPRLREPEGRDACRDALEALGLDGLVVIGGDGSTQGARALADDVPVAVVPATIDRDLEGTELTIGMDSAIGLRDRRHRPAARHGPLAARPRLPPADARRAQRLPRRRGRRGRRHRRRPRAGAPVRPGRDRPPACASARPAARRSPSCRRPSATRSASARPSRAAPACACTRRSSATRSAPRRPSALDRALGQAAGRAAVDALAAGRIELRRARRPTAPSPPSPAHASNRTTRQPRSTP